MATRRTQALEGAVQRPGWVGQVQLGCGEAGGGGLTIQVVVLFTLGISQCKQLPEQKRVLEDPLDGLDEVRLQGG